MGVAPDDDFRLPVTFEIGDRRRGENRVADEDRPARQIPAVRPVNDVDTHVEAAEDDLVARDAIDVPDRRCREDPVVRLIRKGEPLPDQRPVAAVGPHSTLSGGIRRALEPHDDVEVADAVHLSDRGGAGDLCRNRLWPAGADRAVRIDDPELPERRIRVGPERPEDDLLRAVSVEIPYGDLGAHGTGAREGHRESRPRRREGGLLRPSGRRADTEGDRDSQAAEGERQSRLFTGSSR